MNWSFKMSKNFITYEKFEQFLEKQDKNVYDILIVKLS